MSSTTPRVDLRPDHWEIVRNVLRQHFPMRRVVAFGSRATWTAKEYSDLDLAILGEEPLPFDAVAAMAEGFRESDLPFKVDVVVWANINDHLRDIILLSAVDVQTPEAGPASTFAPSSAADRLHLSASHRRVLEGLLHEHLPDVEVWAYGSRVNGRCHDGSDLDLVMRGPRLEKIPAEQLARFADAVRDSTIPFLVEARDWARVPERFRREMEARHMTIVGASSHHRSWSTVRLGDHIDACLGKMLDRKKNRGELLPYLGNKNVRWGSFDTSRLARMRFEGHEHDRYGLKRGDLVVCEGGEPGRCAIWRDDIPGVKIQKALHRIRVKEQLDNRYLHYWFLMSGRSGALEPYFTGTTIKHLTAKSLDDLQIRLPPKPEQQAIAHILGTLDDKIELNQRMNGTLEAMARALFKSWFVNFEPVRAKIAGRDVGLPQSLATLFPDQLDHGHNGDVPRGWSICELADIASARRETVAPTDCGDKTPYIGLEHMPRRSVALGVWGSAQDVTSAKSRFEKGDVLFGKLRPYFHKVGIAPIGGVCSTDIVVIAPKSPEWSAFVTATVSSDQFVSYTDQTSTGTKMPRTSWKTMRQYPLCIPPNRLAFAYEEAVRPALGRIVANIHATRVLASLRDALLPRLVFGQIRVQQAEKALAAIR